MNDNALLQDLKSAQCPDERIATLQQARIITYSRLLNLLGDDTTEPTLRTELCISLFYLSRFIDKRRVVRPMIACLRSNDAKLRSATAVACGMMSLKRTIPHITKLATDKEQPYLPRMDAIQALGSMQDNRALAVLKTIVADESENIGLRGDALQQTQCYSDDTLLHDYIVYLRDDNPDLRFESAYCLSQSRYHIDITPALDILDRVVAFDHTLPTHWGSHIDREALLPFETIYYHMLTHDRYDSWCRTWIVSPADEYDAFIEKYRHWTDTWVYSTDPAPAVTLRIDLSWLIARLQKHWLGISINVREPKPRAYSGDFQLALNDQILIGGLHRDGYTLVLTGFKESAYEFAAWYRSIFVPDQPLFLYAWADFGIELKPGVTAQEIPQLVALSDQLHSSPKN